METGAGWRFLAGTVLGISAAMRFFDALWSWSHHGTLPDNLEGALFGHSLKTYGWIDFIVAILLFAASFGVLAGSQASRWIGIVAGAVMAVTAIWLMPYYPVWSLTYIGLGILTIYALVAHAGPGDVRPFDGLEGRGRLDSQ